MEHGTMPLEPTPISERSTKPPTTALPSAPTIGVDKANQVASSFAVAATTEPNEELELIYRRPLLAAPGDDGVPPFSIVINLRRQKRMQSAPWLISRRTLMT
jgi:hypothetical protein